MCRWLTMRRRHLSVSGGLVKRSCLCHRGQCSCLAQAGTVLQTCDLCVCVQAAEDLMCVCCGREDVRGDGVEREVRSGKAKRSRLWLGARAPMRIGRGSVASGGVARSAVVRRVRSRIGQKSEQGSLTWSCLLEAQERQSRAVPSLRRRFPESCRLLHLVSSSRDATIAHHIRHIIHTKQSRCSLPRVSAC